MDPRLGIETGLYSLDKQLGAQSLLRGSGGYASLSPSHILSSAASGALQPLRNFGGYVDRDLGRPDISSLSHHKPGPVHSLSSGQGYYTLESLEGGPVTAGDGIAARPPFLMQGVDRNVGLGQRVLESNMLSSSMQNGLGPKLASSVPQFGVAGESGPYLTARLPQEVDVRPGSLLRVDDCGASYLQRSQLGLTPGVGAYEDLVPSRLATFGPEMELRRRNELLAALEQRRDLEYEARIREANRETLERRDLEYEARIRESNRETLQRRDLEYKARIREANHEALIREAHIREAQLEHASRIREARLSNLQELKVPERRVGLPLVKNDGLFSRPKRTSTANTTWCSVCQIDCQSPFNLKSHLGGKRHKLKLEEEAEKKNGKSGEKNESEKAKDEGSKPEPSKDEANGTENIQTAIGKGEEQVKEVDGASEAANLKKRSLSDDVEDAPSKKSKNDESGPEGANSEEPAQKPERPREKCDLCNVTCVGKVHLEAHLKGKKHANNVRRLQGLL